MGVEVGLDGERHAEVVEELLGRELARVEAHALAAGLLEELALGHDQPAEGAVAAAVHSARAHQEAEDKGGHDRREVRGVEGRAAERAGSRGELLRSRSQVYIKPGYERGREGGV